MDGAGWDQPDATAEAVWTTGPSRIVRWREDSGGSPDRFPVAETAPLAPGSARDLGAGERRPLGTA